MFNKLSVPFLAFLQTTALLIYIALVSSFFSLGHRIFNTTEMSFFGPIVMLLLFVFSAVISATLILGRFGLLFWDKQYSRAFILLGWTVGWGFVYVILISLVLINA